MWQARPKRFYSTLLCLLCCLSACSPAFASDGAGVPLAELTDSQLLEMLADNLTTLESLQEKQRTELETARSELLIARGLSSEALTLSTEARRLSGEAKDLASRSRDSVATASISFGNYKDAMQAELDKVNRQATWLKVGVGACLAIAAGALVWTAVSSAGGV